MFLTKEKASAISADPDFCGALFRRQKKRKAKLYLGSAVAVFLFFYYFWVVAASGMAARQQLIAALLTSLWCLVLGILLSRPLERMIPNSSLPAVAYILKATGQKQPDLSASCAQINRDLLSGAAAMGVQVGRSWLCGERDLLRLSEIDKVTLVCRNSRRQTWAVVIYPSQGGVILLQGSQQEASRLHSLIQQGMQRKQGKRQAPKVQDLFQDAFYFEKDKMLARFLFFGGFFGFVLYLYSRNGVKTPTGLQLIVIVAPAILCLYFLARWLQIGVQPENSGVAARVLQQAGETRPGELSKIQQQVNRDLADSLEIGDYRIGKKWVTDGRGFLLRRQVKEIHLHYVYRSRGLSRHWYLSLGDGQGNRLSTEYGLAAVHGYRDYQKLLELFPSATATQCYQDEP